MLATLLSSALLATAAFAGAPVDVNSASAETLAASLDGVGMSKARAIVAFRELVKVKGIGLSTVDKNRDWIRIDDGQVARRK